MVKWTFAIAMLLCAWLAPHGMAANFFEFTKTGFSENIEAGKTRSRTATCEIDGTYLVGSRCSSTSSKCNLKQPVEFDSLFGGNAFQSQTCTWQAECCQVDCTLTTRVTCVKPIAPVQSYPVSQRKRTRPPGGRTRSVEIGCQPGYGLAQVSCSSANSVCKHRAEEQQIQNGIEVIENNKVFFVRNRAQCVFQNTASGKRTCTLNIQGTCVKLPPHVVKANK